MSDKKNKKVEITESKLVDLVHNIVEKTIAERIEKGELVRPTQPGLDKDGNTVKTKKVTVSESKYQELLKAGKIISAVKKSL